MTVKTFNMQQNINGKLAWFTAGNHKISKKTVT